MRFVFLGTGTSSGVPAIGCACEVCTSSDPRDARLRVGAAIIFDDAQGHPRVVLIDAGPDLRQQALRAGLTRCDAILFTHNHVDHTFGLDEVRRFNAVQKGPIEVWAEDHTMDHLHRVYRHIFEKDANVNDSFVATLIPRRIDPGMVNGPGMEVFGLKVTPLRLLHGRLPIVGFRIDRSGASPGRGSPEAGATGFLPLAYCTDVSGIPPETYPHLRGLGTLVLDALRHRHHPTHLTLSDSVGIAERVGAGRTFFIHMAHDLAHEATNATLPPGMQLAHDGLVLEDGPLPEKPRVDEPEETGA
ncbi:MAG: MBL fold metallo-hydrolase [Phycisphaerae bacterium]|nr:MBL fold metallo-hydrolase [Phycisphaerae bacterium]